MLNIAILEDCSIQAEVILELLTEYLKKRLDIKWNVKSFSSGEELFDSIEAGDVYNLLLLDILMPGLNGMELARLIKKQDDGAKIIFLTATKDYAIEAFRIFADYYLVKPVKRKEFYPVLDKVIKKTKDKNELFFRFPMLEADINVPYSSIICVELATRRPRIHLERGEILTGKCLRQSFNDFIAPLLKDKRFIHTHKSYAINLSYVSTHNTKTFIMKNNLSIPITKNKYSEAKERFYSSRYEND